MKLKRRITAEVTFTKGNITHTYEIDDNLISAYFEDLDRGSSDDLIDFGIYANRGTLEFVDTDNIFQRHLIELSDYSTTVRFFWYESLLKRILLKTISIEDFEFEETTKKVKLSLISPIINWQSITINKIFLLSRGQIQLSQLIDIVNTYIPAEQKIRLFANVGSICIDCVLLEPTTVWDCVSKICVLCGGRIFESSQGFIYLYSPMINKPEGQDCKINPSSILKISNHVPTYKNREKYNSPISISYNQTRKVFEDEVCAIKFEVYEAIDLSNGVVNFVGDSKSKNLNVIVQGEQEAEFSYVSCDIPVSSEFTVDYSSLTFDATADAASLQKPSFSGPNYIKKNQNLLVAGGTVNTPSGNEVSLSNIKICTNIDNETNNLYALTTKLTVSGDFFIKFPYVAERKYNNVQNPLNSPIKLSTNELFQYPSENIFGEGKWIDFYLEGVHRELNRESLECETNSTSAVFPITRDYVVMPYVMKKGVRVPFADTVEKNNYAVIGIKYSYKGFLRQTLCLQSI